MARSINVHVPASLLISLRSGKFRVSSASAHRWAEVLSNACTEFEVNTPNRLAHFLGQLMVESGSLVHVREIASGVAYNNRADLGNTQPGDGVRFKGRGLIQVTGRSNYTAFYEWLRGRMGSIAPNVVANPSLLERDDLAALASVWYWRYRANAPCRGIGGARNDANGIADLGVSDAVIDAATSAVNGCYPSPGANNHRAERREMTLLAHRILSATPQDFFGDTAGVAPLNFIPDLTVRPGGAFGLTSHGGMTGMTGATRIDTLPGVGALFAALGLGAAGNAALPAAPYVPAQGSAPPSTGPSPAFVMAGALGAGVALSILARSY